MLYVDLMSQPSRACAIFCRVCGIDVEERPIKIAKKEQLSPQYLAVNPLGKLPCLQEGEFVLPESASILRYLASTCNVAPHWYPDNPRRRARVDAALDWQHANVRAGEAKLVYHSVLTRNLGGPFEDDKVLAKTALTTLRQALKALDTVWLKDSTLVAGDDISIADLLMCCELEQLVMLSAAAPDVPRFEALMEPFSRVQAWRERVKAATQPHFGAVSSFLYTVAERMSKASAQSKM